MLLKLFSNLFGYNYEVVKAQTTVSKQKIITLGTLMLIPVSLWTISGFYIGYDLLGAGFFQSLIGGLFVGTLILIIDKSFLTTPKESVSKWLKTFRVVFAVVATILGSIALDLMFFSGDLEEYREKKSAKIQKSESDSFMKENNHLLTNLENSISKQQSITEASKIDWKNEADGTGGSGSAGIDKIALLKEGIYKSDAAKLAQMEASLLSIKDSLGQEAILYGQKMATKKSNALLSKVTDLHDFILSSGLSMFFYGLFFVAVFSLEIFFLITKSSTADSLFDKMLYAEERMGERRLQTLMTQRDEILRQDGLFGPRAERIRQLASEHDNIRKIG
ncbi:DUF4407 domain-containing protein [Aquiflexum sp. LQ15W]|uniref:DUF4407 domain-containing protein n=1 Tax=Cognataquiflexum nitidum TaxID=2922272 RepID=UPI001F12AB35|nr:DUF4407 domain-containing protein [Cognataquiflexum nitidum]MCH6198574.1 DUF4407 domain-containing protein [Cognataquiflexum nitidum]